MEKSTRNPALKLWWCELEMSARVDLTTGSDPKSTEGV